MIESEAIVMWPDGTWCYGYELHEMTHMGDDHTVVSTDHPEYSKILNDLL